VLYQVYGPLPFNSPLQNQGSVVAEYSIVSTSYQSIDAAEQRRCTL